MPTLSTARRIRRDQLRVARRIIRDENRRWPAHLVPVPESQWPDAQGRDILGVWRSRSHFVAAYGEDAGVIRLSINRAEIDAQGDYRDGLTWDELQSLKSQCGYGDRQAVEIYPPDAHVVNVANIRHLWILPQPLACQWQRHDA